MGLLDGGMRSRVYWVGRGVYNANLSIVQFRATMLGIHVYVYILLIHQPEDGHKRRNM